MKLVNETLCQMVFTSANLNNGTNTEDIKFNLWHADYCAMKHWLLQNEKQINAKLHESLRKLSKDTEDMYQYQGEATYSSNGAELAFVQAIPAESK
jgi:hypothetical protein